MLDEFLKPRLISVFVILFAALSGCDFGPPDPSSLIGTSPAFEVETFQTSAKKTSLRSLQGHAVLIDFWATWCGPCHMLSPYVESVYDKYKARGLEGMAITDEDRRTVQKYELQEPHKMPVFIDAKDLATKALMVSSLPTVLVVDRSGKVQYVLTGFDSIDIHGEVQRLDDAVAKALRS